MTARRASSAPDRDDAATGSRAAESSSPDALRADEEPGSSRRRPGSLDRPEDLLAAIDAEGEMFEDDDLDPHETEPAPLGDEEEPDAEPEGQFVSCPFCGGEGQLPFLQFEDGTRRPLDPPQSSRTEQCTNCTGLGMVKTGSAVPDHAFATCGPCQGQGFVAKADSPPELRSLDPPEAGVDDDESLRKLAAELHAQPATGG